MNRKFLRCILSSGVLMTLVACATTSQSSNKLMAVGTARDVPLLIYSTSWNSGVVATPLSVELINTGHSQIDSVSLFVAACPLNVSVPDTYKVNLTGPFLPARAYLVHGLPQFTSVWYDHPSDMFALINRYIRGFVIRAIGITDGGGKEIIYSDNVPQFLTSNISNFCRGS